MPNKSMIDGRALSYILLGLLTCLLGTYAVVAYWGGLELSAQEKALRTDLTVEIELRKSSLQFVMEDLKKDLLFIAQTPALNGFSRAHANQGFDPLENTDQKAWERHFSQLAISFLQINPSAYWLRIIGLPNGGKELLKFERKGDEIKSVSVDELFQKSMRPFFIETTKLKQNEVYLSDINLRHDDDKIHVPHQISLRASTPIFLPDHKMFGMVVLNVDLKPEFNALKSDLPKGAQLYLVDSEGTYLIHPDNEKTFGKDLNTTYRWQKDATSLAQAEEFGLIDFAGSRFYQAHDIIEIGGGANLRKYPIAILYPESLVTAAVQSKKIKAAGLLLTIELVLGLILMLILKNKYRDAQLLNEKSQLVSIIENSGEAIIGQDLAGRITSWNSAATWIFGYSENTMLGKSLREFLIPPELRDEDIELIDRAKKGEIVPSFRSTRLTKDGEKIRVLISISPILDVRKNVVGIAKTLRDIGMQEVAENQIINHNLLLERQVAERTQELESAYADYAHLVESAPFALIQVDAEGIIKKCNLEAVNIFGYSRTELLNSSIDQLLPESFRGKHAHLRGTYLDNPSPRRMGSNRDLFARHKSGNLFPVEIGLVTVSRDGEVHVIAAITDITERKKLEYERNKLSQILEMTPDFIGTADIDGNLGYHNKASFDMLGIPVGTDFYGAYMTDIIKDFPMLSSKEVLKYLKGRPKEVAEQVDKFREELKFIGSYKPLILTFGRDVFNVLSKNLDKSEYSNLIRLTHYSHQISKENYRIDTHKRIGI